MFLVDYLAEHAETHLEGADFGSAVRVWLLDHAISWTRTRSTLMFFRDTLSETDAQMFHPDMHKIQMEIDQLLGHRTWSFLSMGEEKKEANRDIADRHQECHWWKSWWEQRQSQDPQTCGSATHCATRICRSTQIGRPTILSGEGFIQQGIL